MFFDNPINLPDHSDSWLFKHGEPDSDIECAKLFHDIGFTTEEIVIAMQVIESACTLSQAIEEVVKERRKSRG